MVDNMKATTITIWAGCDPLLADAIKKFSEAWGPYSVQSRRYSIFRLLREEIDPAWQGLVARFPALTIAAMKTAWVRYQYYRSRSGTTIDQDGNAMEMPCIAFPTPPHEGEIENFDSLAQIGQQHGFAALERFIYFVIRSSPTYHGQSTSDITLTASLDSLRGLANACRSKKPKKVSLGHINALRGRLVCRFCDQPTELSAHAAGSPWPIDDIEIQLRLSSLYCSTHRPKEVFQDAVRADYLRVKRNQQGFDRELERLDNQCWAGTSAAYAKSGNDLVDGFIRRFATHKCLTYEQQPPDKHDSLETRLRWEARMLVDQRMTDRKKEIVMLLLSGLNQSEAAKQLGLERQAISKALQSIPIDYRLDLLCQPAESTKLI